MIKVVPNNDKLKPDFHIMVRIDPHSLKMCSRDPHDHIETSAMRSGQLVIAMAWIELKLVCKLVSI